MKLAAAFCLVLLHSPDGSVIWLERDAVSAIKPISPRHHDHLPFLTHTVVYLDGRSSGFGVVETAAEVAKAVNNCK